MSLPSQRAGLLPKLAGQKTPADVLPSAGVFFFEALGGRAYFGAPAFKSR
ncbi:hypothetical protein MHY1_01232 [Methylovirgula sp. HY1]|nr:hypothetical protein MHY1_01232 [Methylovirgula sp. HY1]